MKILTYNIQDGGIGREELILNVIEQIDADVIILQEISNPSIVYRLSNKCNLHSFVARGNSKRSLAILSKYKMAHLNSFHPIPLKHTLLEAKYIKHRQEIFLFGTHLAPYPFLLFEMWRLYEVSKILSRIGKLGSKHYIICGDFNSVAPGDIVSFDNITKWIKFVLCLTQGGLFFRFVIEKIYKSGLLDCHKELNHNDTGYTLTALNPHIRLDYFFVSPSLRNKVRQCNVVMYPDMVNLASDHLPVLLEIDI